MLGNLDVTGTRTQQELADSLGIHRNNMVGLIDDLEASGLVERHRSAIDRRAFDIRLTAAGAQAVADVNSFIAPLDEVIGQGLDRRERRILTDLLQRVAASLDLTPGVHPHLATRVR